MAYKNYFSRFSIKEVILAMDSFGLFKFLFKVKLITNKS